MNRVIKFRAWDGKNKEMVLAWDDGAFFLTSEGVPYDIFKRAKLPWKLMQFTGLTDKNGKEIYEGDILDHLGLSYRVGWGDEGAWIAWGITQRDDPRNGEPYTIADTMVANVSPVGEIIGNIYENPELLTNN